MPLRFLLELYTRMGGMPLRHGIYGIQLRAGIGGL